jgi:hypothetical protein
MSDQERISQIRRIKQEIEAALLEIPGVTGVDIGYKVVGGKETGDLAIRVYVAEKKAPEAIPASERVPESIEDVPTDVIERRYVLHGSQATQLEPEESIDATEGKGADP